MGEEDVVVNTISNCGYISYRRDCDGDYDTYCYYSGSCPYKKTVKDCDGDMI